MKVTKLFTGLGWYIRGWLCPILGHHPVELHPDWKTAFRMQSNYICHFCYKEQPEQ